MDDREVKYLIGLGQIFDMNQTSISLLMEAFGDAEKAWKSTSRWYDVLPQRREKVKTLLRNKEKVDLEAFDEYRKRLQVKVTTAADADFPGSLLHVSTAPYYLFYYGALPDPDKLHIAVVGARKASDYGRQATEKLVTDLVEKADVGIISGMAEGIDGVAHWAALRAGGYTAAVLGNGIDLVYPSFHRKLYDTLKEKGCIISEFPLGYESLAHNFPLRNRLISGLANGVLVTEARSRSGSLHTVKHGLDQGKAIYACPGSIFAGGSGLPHYLIETGQAKFTACAEDILEDFIDVDLVERMQRSAETDAFRFATGKEERAVIYELQRGRRSFDELLAVTALSASELSVFLTGLEVEGVLYEAPGQLYALKNQ